MRVELGIRGLGGGRVDGGSWSSGEVGLGPVALDQGGQAAGLRGSHVLSWYGQWIQTQEGGHRRKGEAGRRRCCLSFCELQPWMSGGDSYSRVCLPMQRPGGSLEVFVP